MRFLFFASSSKSKLVLLCVHKNNMAEFCGAVVVITAVVVVLVVVVATVLVDVGVVLTSW